MGDIDWHAVLAFVSIPIFTGVVGWAINWSGLIMLFSPLQFHGKRVPGMKELATILPRKMQEVPGLLQGGIGWQGIIPARAAKMGSIAVDKAIAKLGTPAEFYQQLEPDQIAEHIVTVFRPEVPELVNQVMLAESPRLWRDLPQPVKQAIYQRVQAQLPSVVGTVTTEIGIHIDQLLDPKIMVIDHFQENPDLVVRIFRDFGQKELDLMVRFGFVFGFLLGVPVAIVDAIFHQWYLLPLLGVVVGWVTNALGMWLIFEPPEPKRILGIKVHGLFLRRQSEAAEVYARIIADDVITLERIGDFLLDGPRGDRTRQMLATALRPAIDNAAGPARGALRVAMGGSRFDTIRDSVAQEAVGRTLTPFKDPEFSARQAEKIRTLIATRTKELPPRDFVEMMRSAIKEDEWMLYAHGAIMGAAGGFLHLLIFGTQGGLIVAGSDDRSDEGRLPALRDDVLNPALEALPGLARVAASAAWHTTGWGVRTSARSWRRLGRAMTSQQEAAALAHDAGQAIAVVTQLARSVSSGASVATALMNAGAGLGGAVEPGEQVVEAQVVVTSRSSPEPSTLRDRGRELLERSRDVWSTEQGHPAFERILGELAPDEGRILLLLLNKGPQPSVDVRTGGPLGRMNSVLIAPGLNMIGPRAGCRYVDSTPSYLNNLFRLGLVWFSREPLPDPMDYQVVEAQPDVLEAMHSVKFAKVVRRSIHLTPFGEDFCKTCLIEEAQASKEFPEHATPPAGETIDPG